MPIAHVERQEKGCFTVQPCGHVHLFQIHRKVHEGTGLEQKQARLWIPLGAELIDSVLIGLTGSVALELKCDDSEAVQKDDHVNALFITGSYLLHHRENVLAVLLRQLRIEGGRGLGVHGLQLSVRNFNAVLQHFDEAAASLGGFRVDEADDGIFQAILVYFLKIRHCVRLCVVQELEQYFPVNGKHAIEIGSFADDKTVVLLQSFQQELLIIFLGQDIAHQSFLPLALEACEVPALWG